MDNIFIERLWRSLKYEAVYLHDLADGFETRLLIDEWIGFYEPGRAGRDHWPRLRITRTFERESNGTVTSSRSASR